MHLSPCPTVRSLPTICDELARVINRHISPQMSRSCVTSVLVKTVLRVPYDMSTIFMTKYKYTLAILYEFIRYLYEFCDMCSHTTFVRHVYEFLRVYRSSARPLASLYDLVRYTICYDIHTKLVRQRTNLARFSTISHNFYTTSDAFRNKNGCMRFQSMVIFPLGLKSETNMTLQP